MSKLVNACVSLGALVNSKLLCTVFAAHTSSEANLDALLAAAERKNYEVTEFFLSQMPVTMLFDEGEPFDFDTSSVAWKKFEGLAAQDPTLKEQMDRIHGRRVLFDEINFPCPAKTIDITPKVLAP